MTTTTATFDLALRRRLIVALDVGGEAPALRLAERLAGTAGFFKVGLELFTLAGPGIVGRVRAAAGEGSGVFLDLKFHDIPNTVERATRAAAELGVELLTVHLTGGTEMLRAAVRGAASAPTLPPTVLGVSVLTSATAETLRETGVAAEDDVGVAVETQVMRLARLGAAAGVGGFVASPWEVVALRREFGPGPRLVIPGVRPAGGDAGDQRRIMTPGEALAAGADQLVVGRPITGAADPRTAAERILEEMEAVGVS